MKALVASLGQHASSLVAKRFEHASWYLIVDSEKGSTETLPHRTPHERHAALERAAAEGVSVVVAEKFGENTLKFLRAHDMRIAQLHGIPVSEAIERLNANSVPLLDAEAMISERNMVVATLERLLPKKRAQKAPANTASYSSDSPRGHHHLQQYAGRGH